MRKFKQHNNDVLTHLGNAMRNRRVDAKLTQQQIATATNMHRTYITDIEAGHRNLSMLTYSRLAHALHCAMSVPMIDAERSMARQHGQATYGFKGGLSNASELLHSTGSFLKNLEIDSFEFDVLGNMSKLQFAVESYARSHKRYPRDEAELEEALAGRKLINPFLQIAESPTIGSAIDEEFATRTSCLLRPGEIEYSPMNSGSNYIIRGGAGDGKALQGTTPGSTYVLSGNLRKFNQP